MKLSLLLSEEYLKIVLDLIFKSISASSVKWFATSTTQQQTILSFLISQLILQSSINNIVRKNCIFDINHFASIRSMIVKLVKEEMEVVGSEYLPIGLTTGKKIKRYTCVGLRDIGVVIDIINLFEEGGSKCSDKFAFEVFEHVSLIAFEATKFIKKAKWTEVNDQGKLF